jgi:hypoxanthine phosphoribosyltransferase
MERIYLSWREFEKLISTVIPQLQKQNYDSVLAITRGGIIPGGLIAERLGISKVMIASVDFYSDEESDMDWPVFMQFPMDNLLQGERVLIVDDVWDKGKETTTVRERVEQAGGTATTFVMHYKPHRSIFPNAQPDCYTAITQDWIIYPWELDRTKHGIR